MTRFLVVWLAITVLCWLTAGVLFAPLLPGGGVTVAAAAVLASAPLLVLIRGFTRARYPGAAMRLFVLRPFWYVQLVLPLVALAGLAGVVAGLFAGAFRGTPVETALTAGRWGAAAVSGIAVVFFAAGYVGARRLVVRRYTASSPALPHGFDGVRLVQLSDLHVGPHTSRRQLARIATATRESRPDLIVLTGDLVDDYARDVEPFATGLGGFAAPLGVFAIPGNHDVYAGWSAVRAGLEAQGITVLVNTAARLERNGDAIALLGTGDPAGHHWHRGGGDAAIPDVAAAVRAARAIVPPAGHVLALAHNPVLWPQLANAGVALTLSGHTHWGQFAIPEIGWSLASPFLKHAMGVYVDGPAVLYVHPGTNYWGLPFRLGTPPEVAVITLRKGDPGFAPDAA